MVPQRHALLGHSTTKPISQTIISIFFIATARTPQLATTNPGDLGGLPPRNPPGHRPQNHLLHLHPPLPRGLGTLLHALIADTQPFADSLKANISRLTWADMSCANDSHITIKILDKVLGRSVKCRAIEVGLYILCSDLLNCLSVHTKQIKVWHSSVLGGDPFGWS